MAKKRKQRDLLTPFKTAKFDLATATKGEGKELLFRKQILPITTINYEGEKVAFDQEYHDKLLAAFKDKAYRQVPFVLADPKTNEHTMDPERFRGVVKDIEPAQAGEAPGLYATISFPNRKLAKAVLDNSELGVSCRIREFVEKSDGREYDAAIMHVCGTLAEHVDNMAPWEAISLSGYSSAREVVDLTSATYQEDNMPKGTKTKKRSSEEIDLSELVDQIDKMTKPQLAEFIQKQFDLSEAEEDDSEDDIVDEDESDDDSEDDSEDESEDEDDEDEGDVVDEDVEDDKPKGKKSKDLSAKAQRQIDMSRQQAEAAQANADRALTLLSDQRWDSERLALLNKGIPAKLVDLCEPFLHVKETHTLDLSDGRKLNATSRIRKILDEVAGQIDLSGPKGHGTPANEGKTAKDAALLDTWEEQYPTR